MHTYVMFSLQVLCIVVTIIIHEFLSNCKVVLQSYQYNFKMAIVGSKPGRIPLSNVSWYRLVTTYASEESHHSLH